MSRPRHPSSDAERSYIVTVGPQRRAIFEFGDGLTREVMTHDDWDRAITEVTEEVAATCTPRLPTSGH